MKRLITLFILFLVIQTIAVGDRNLTANEAQTILEGLCNHPGSGWIEQGQIEAIHQSFEAETGETRESRQAVATDGNRFIWNIQETSVKKNGQPDIISDQTKWNQERTFVWDGQTYTLYFKTVKHVISQESPDMPIHVTGPLTAGFIPWGEGLFTIENLTAALTSAVETTTDEGNRVSLTLTAPNQPVMHFLLDPDKNYVPLSYTRIQSANSKTVQTYGNYIQSDGRYVPMNILIETFINNQLHSSKIWEIVSIQNDIPPDETFSPDIEEKTLVEYYSPVLDTPSYYRHSKQKNMKALLQERWTAGLKKGIQKQNCGSVATEHILKKFGGNAADAELISLVNDISGDTTLYQIQQFLQEKGLHSLAVKTGLESLQKLHNCQVLIHLPEKKHFVVLDRIDSKGVWLIDLDRQSFYHTMTPDEFEQQWAGIALIVSNQTLAPGKQDIPVPDAILKRIKGSADYTCSKLLQDYRVIHCPMPVLGTCGGRYELYYPRYACEETTDSGFCSGTGVVGSVYSECVQDPYDPGQCTITGDWKSRYMRACQP